MADAATLSERPFGRTAAISQSGPPPGAESRLTQLSDQPVVHPPAAVRDSVLGRYTEIAANCHVHHSRIGDYSYALEGTQIAYAKIGKFANIAAHVRIYASKHPMQRASLHHFTYRSSWYFDGEPDDQAFFDWRSANRPSLPSASM